MKPIILITIALGCGLVAAVGVYQQMDKAAATPQVEKVNVVVAKKEVSINEALSEENVEITEWAVDQVPEGAVATLEELKDMYARTRLYPGEVLLQDKIMGATEASSSILVPKGYRVVSVRVSMDSSVSNLIVPGDRVDVIVALSAVGLNTGGMAKIILEGVRVFAVNSDISRSLASEGSPDEARAVSLILKPNQVERLAMAAKQGTITLSLRSPDDAGVEETPGCTLDQALGRVADVPDEVSNGELILNRDPEKQEKPSGPYWSMAILSPGNAQQFNWASQNAVPRMEVLYSDSNSTADEDTEAGKDGDMDSDNDIAISDYSNADG